MSDQQALTDDEIEALNNLLNWLASVITPGKDAGSLLMKRALAELKRLREENVRLSQAIKIEYNRLHTAERRAWHSLEQRKAAEATRDKLQAHLTKSIDDHEAALAEIAALRRGLDIGEAWEDAARKTLSILRSFIVEFDGMPETVIEIDALLRMTPPNAVRAKEGT